MILSIDHALQYRLSEFFYYDNIKRNMTNFKVCFNMRLSDNVENSVLLDESTSANILF